MGNQNIFKRYELKYLISGEQKQQILRIMEPFMAPDQFGRHSINNIYYDTMDDLLIRRSLEKPVYKEKLRVRSYGTADTDSEVFVELKKKYKGVVYKRRISMTQREAEDYLAGKRKAPKQTQITDEIDYFLHFYQGLRPAVYLSYEREAFYGTEDENLRITFDEDILWRDENISLLQGPYGTPILKENQVLMEIKVPAAMPLWLATALSEKGIFKTSFSKYGQAYMQKKTEQKKAEQKKAEIA